MVFVWSNLTDGDPAYTLVQVSLNDLIMLLLFAPIVTFLITGASDLTVPFEVLLYSVLIFIVAPLALGSAAASFCCDGRAPSGSRTASCRPSSLSPPSHF
jgi:ACR3 family arsenite efflux pump ArsB